MHSAASFDESSEVFTALPSRASEKALLLRQRSNINSAVSLAVFAMLTSEIKLSYVHGMTAKIVSRAHLLSAGSLQAGYQKRFSVFA